MKKVFVLLLALAMLCAISACGKPVDSTSVHTHSWEAATCDAPKTCKVCGMTDGNASGHDWEEATCDAPKTCKVCGMANGNASGHDWEEATCDAPKTCKVCGMTNGNASGHDWEAATCDAPKTCKVCGKTDGNANGHDWEEATCDAPKTCKVCGKIDGNANGHDWEDATCIAPKTCKICGLTDGSTTGHEWEDATCVAPKTCKICGLTDGSTTGHEWEEATCIASKTCKVCGLTDGNASGHDWEAATCVEPKTCEVCGMTDGNASGHDFEKLFSTDGYNIGSKVIQKCKKCEFVEMYTVGVYDYIVEDTLPAGNGEKVRVVLLGGQSNASGCSHDAYLKKNVSPEKYAEYDNGYDNIYINYFVSGSYQSHGFVKCATRQGEFGNCFGPELGLAEKLNELYPDETIFIIKYAWGGTNLFEQWLSPSSSVAPGVLYNQFVTFAEQSIQYLVSKGYQVEIEGMCWMQGESDSFSVENAVDYKVHLSNFIKDIRNQFNPYASPNGIAFIDACIADNPVYWVYCDLVNESKREVEKESPMNALIDTNANGLTCNLEPEDQPDIPHYDSLSQIKLGNLFALEIVKFFD